MWYDSPASIQPSSNFFIGPLVGGFVVTDKGWRWTSWVPLMLIAVVYGFGGMMPETYPREILRRRARKAGVPHNLPKAQSGVTIGEMAHLTIVQPVMMLFSAPNRPAGQASAFGRPGGGRPAAGRG
jgi:MFS family permease